MPSYTCVKICCIADIREAWLAIQQGVAAVGLVSEMPSGPGIITEAQIAQIAAALPPGVSSFLLTCQTDAAAIIDQQRRCGTNTIQLCDRVETCIYHYLRKSMPGIKLVQVLHVAGPPTVATAQKIAPHVDALLLDSGNPTAQVKVLGGTGRIHDWQLSRQIVETVAVPVFLAGGLRPDNVRKAVQTVGPYGVDVCTGVRSGGQLDALKLAEFTAQVRGT